MRESIEKNKLVLVLLVGGVVLVAFGGLVWKINRSETGTKIEFLHEEVAGEATEAGTLMVDVEGAVISPGVYKLPPAGRVAQAIAQAGGLASDADRDWVQKYLNQAEKIKDGMKIFIPRAGVVGSTSSTTININTVGEGELDTLPGIGPVTAKKIMAGRPYGRAEELLEKKIVTAKVWDQIKELIGVW